MQAYSCLAAELTLVAGLTLVTGVSSNELLIESHAGIFLSSSGVCSSNEAYSSNGCLSSNDLFT